MRFALLNVDAELLSAAESLAAAGHELSLVVRPGDYESALTAIAPRIRVLDDWEGLLACGADAVLLGRAGPDADRLEKLRLFAQENVTTLLLHPQTTSVLAYYELDMHRQAGSARLVPYEPLRQLAVFSPVSGATATDAATSVDTTKIEDAVDQVICERRLTDRSRPSVLRQLACDLGAVRRLVGPIEKVSALGTIGDDPAAGHLGVQMTASGGALVRWSIAPAVAADDLKLTIVRKSGSTTVEIADKASVDADRITAVLADSSGSLWAEALADMEIVEAVERSLRRGRTIELFHEQPGEHGTFKGLMSAGGCLLLTVSICLPIVASIVGKFRFGIADLWPKVLLAVLVPFLLLQLLKFVFPRETK